MSEFLIYLLKSAGLLLVFFGFYFFILRKDTSFVRNRKFLLGGILSSAVLPAVYFTRTIIVEATSQPLNFVQGDVELTEIISQDPTFSTSQILFAIYLAGVVVMVGRFIFQSLSLFRILFSGKTSEYNGIKYVETQREVAPFSFLSFIVYNPSIHPEEELKHILNHEKVHVSQWHTADVLLANLNLIYQWFNPFAWLYIKNLQQNLEFVADREAIKESTCIKEYQKALVKISVENFSISLTNNFYQSFIKKRIVMLNKKSSATNSLWKTGLIIPVLLMFLLTFNVKTVAQIKEDQNQGATTSAMNITASISKSSTREDLENVQRIFAKKGIIVDFTKVERNPEGLISAISVELKNSPTNLIGNLFRDDPQGIETFQIFIKGSGETGFVDAQTSAGKTGGNNPILKIGKDPLYIINNKEYLAAELDGKSILVENGYLTIDAEDAAKKYGDKAKDGAVIVSEGRIIDDFNEELKEIDEKNLKTSRRYLQIEKGKSPSFITLNNDPGKTEVEVRISSSGNIKGTGSRNSNGKALTLKEGEGDPVYVVNGTVLGNAAMVQDIAPENISTIQVIKGASATSLYGEAGKNGEVIITTKAKDSITGIKGNGASSQSFKGKSNSMVNGVSYSNGKSISITSANENDSTETRKFKSFNISTEGVEIIASQFGNNNKVYFVQTGSTQSTPLYVVDGKEMEKEFDAKSIDPQNIKSINVLKRDLATKKYREAGKNGVIEITTSKKSNLSNNQPVFAKISASTTEEGLSITKQQLKEQANLEVTFDDVKRNKNGLISQIKISGKNGSSTASATFEVEEGIPDVFLGLRDGSIIISSNPPKK